MRPIVIDTNCLLQIIARKSHFNVLHTISFPHLNLVTLDEFLGKLKDFSTEPTVAANGERQ